MALINAVNNSLKGQAGSDKFVGDNSPILTGDIDYGIADSLRINNSITPVLTQVGEIAVDTQFTSHAGMLTYHDGSSQQYVPSILPADLSTNDQYAVSYNSGSSKFELVPQSGGGGGIITQVAIGTHSSLSSTTSASYVDTGLTVSITPLSASSNLWVRCYCYIDISSSVEDRSGGVAINITSGTPSLLVEQVIRNTLRNIPASPKSMFVSCFTEVTVPSSGLTSHSFSFRFRIIGAGSTIAFGGDTYPGKFVVMEIA